MENTITSWINTTEHLNMENSSSLNTTEHCPPSRPSASGSFLLDIYSCVGVVGIVLNIFCLAVLRKLTMNIFNCLLLQLAVFDIIHLVCNIGLMGFQPKSPLLITILDMGSSLGNGAAFQTTLAISMERYLGLLFSPFQVRAHNNTVSSQRYTFFCYFFLLIVATFGNYTFRFVQYATEGLYPEDHKIHTIIYYLLNASIVFMFLECILLLLLNVRIYVELKKVAKERETLREGNKTPDWQVSMLLLIATASLIVYIPWCIFLWVQNFTNGILSCEAKSVMETVFFFVAAGLSYVNASCNFFIYNWTGRRFREVFSKLWICRKFVACLTELSACIESTTSKKSEEAAEQPKYLVA